jgi:hypothetical protein
MKKYKVVKKPHGWAVADSASGEIVAGHYTNKKLAAAACVNCESGAFWPSKQKQKVWVVGNVYVCEAGLGGMMLGEIRKLDMTQYEVVEQLTQAEFDKRMMKFFEKTGYFPDT